MNDMPPPPPEPVRLPQTDKTPEAPPRDDRSNATQPKTPDLRTFSAAPGGKERADAPQNASTSGNDSANSRMTTNSDGQNTVVPVDNTRTAQSKTDVVGSTPGKPSTPENAPATPNTPEKDRLPSDSHEKDRSGTASSSSDGTLARTKAPNLRELVEAKGTEQKIELLAAKAEPATQEAGSTSIGRNLGRLERAGRILGGPAAIGGHALVEGIAGVVQGYAKDRKTGNERAEKAADNLIISNIPLVGTGVALHDGLKEKLESESKAIESAKAGDVLGAAGHIVDSKLAALETATIVGGDLLLHEHAPKDKLFAKATDNPKFIQREPVKPGTTAGAKPEKSDVKVKENSRGGPGDSSKDFNAGRGMSDDQARYQQQITGESPDKGYYVGGLQFDGWKDGKLLDAKHLGDEGRFARAYENMNRGNFSDIAHLVDRGGKLLDQAKAQVKAADGTPIVWHVSGDKAAQALNLMFKVNDLPPDLIRAEHTPYQPPKRR